jgi:hypothetical protein
MQFHKSHEIYKCLHISPTRPVALHIYLAKTLLKCFYVRDEGTTGQYRRVL